MPKTYFCWRCKMPIPMLTDDEWEEVEPLLRLGHQRIENHRKEKKAGLRETIDSLRLEACEKYLEITGFRETNPDALWHHRLSEYGPECCACGHLLRTPKASFCANCGARPGQRSKEGD